MKLSQFRKETDHLPDSTLILVVKGEQLAPLEMLTGEDCPDYFDGEDILTVWPDMTEEEKAEITKFDRAIVLH